MKPRPKGARAFLFLVELVGWGAGYFGAFRLAYDAGGEWSSYLLAVAAVMGSVVAVHAGAIRKRIPK